MANQPSRSSSLAATRRSSHADRDGATLLKRTCQTCGKVVCRASDLSRHILIHTGIKEHVCRQCSKAFTQKSALKTHMNTHTGATPYTCEYCHKAFRDPSVRSRHIEEQHLQKKMLHECSICAERDDGNSIKYRRRDVLRRHLKTKHGITLSASYPKPRKVSVRNASCRTRTTSPGMYSALQDQDDSAMRKTQLDQFRPTRRSALRATDRLASLIRKETDPLTIIDDDDDDMGDTQNDATPTSVPIFDPSYALTPSPHTKNVQDIPRDVPPRDRSFAYAELHSSLGGLKAFRRRRSSLYLMFPPSPDHLSGIQDPTQFMRDRAPLSNPPPLCIDPSILQRPERD